MALKITDECINCGACVDACPNTSIYVYEEEWTISEGNTYVGKVQVNGKEVDSTANQKALSDDFFFIVPEKCTECVGFHEEPQCAVECPVDCCISDENYVESQSDLLKKKNFLHP
ncbi:MAG: 4Fe-4S dicluster domain-containing protein [Crocinitomix sp.]|nr:4Fe-4S dicluster domain-containing protein [Crocinitomix sp.]